MGKIPVQELAKMMGISNQDLVFKLRSIGVRIEGDNAHIDTDIISAILQGKKLPHPREVILRDEPAQAAPSPGPSPRRPPGRRMPPPANPLRPGRPRTLIQKVEGRISTIPTSIEKEKPAPRRSEVTPASEVTPVEVAEVVEVTAATQAAEMAQAAEATRTASTVEEAKAAEKDVAGKEAAAETVAASAPAPAPTTVGVKKERKDDKRGIPPTPVEAPPPEPEDKRAEAREEKKVAKKGRRKKAASGRVTDVEDLTSYRGSVRELEEVTEEVGAPTKASPTSSRRKRRVERKKAASVEKATTGKVLPFRETESGGPVIVSEGMTVRDFAEKLGVKAKDLIKTLFERGVMANINHILEPELAEEVAHQLGYEVMVVSFEEEVQLKQELEIAEGEQVGARTSRAPVVTIMGHVDHGKTSLLDAIRSSKITEDEFGGITQHIGAYRVDVGDGRAVVFLDTPGHEAFTMMRARGARVTDIVVLMVAADDGVMPQTVEAINHARAAEVPLVVAINKIDKPNANPDRVKKQLADHDLLVEDWGGTVVAVPISAKKNEGIDELLEMILLTADLQELKATPELPAQGTVLEAKKDIGRGTVATVLVQDGTLHVGDVFVTGATWGRVRAMTDDLGHRIPAAGASTPVEVTGFSNVPEAGDLFQAVEDEAKARGIAEFRRQEQRRRGLAPSAGKLSLEQLFHKIEEGEVKELPVVLKADVQGSVEVLREALEKASTEKVRVRPIMAAVGAISTNDVLLASASRAIVIGFNVRPERNAADLADQEGVDIRLHTVIYEVLDELKKAMTGLLEPEYKEVTKGRAEVREIFKVPKAGMVAGCHVVEGSVPRNAQARLLRDNVVVYDGRLSSLRRFKEDTAEVRTGFDCGISLDRFQDYKPGDVIEAYVREEVAPSL